MDEKEQLVEAVLRAAEGEGKRLACAKAFELAAGHGAKLAEIGRICNENNVNICKCQLGCFK